MITFAAAHELRHTSCSLAHGNKLTPFFSSEEICAIAEQRPVESITEAEQEMMRFSRQVARDASTVEAADVDRLKAFGFSDAEVFDIAAVAAGRAFFTKVLDAVGSLPDAGFMSIDEDLRTPLTVGRPISTEADEVMNDVTT
jgi:alkylhydroperoxidase family enzyme